jgi:hypothetical protein
MGDLCITSRFIRSLDNLAYENLYLIVKKILPVLSISEWSGAAGIESVSLVKTLQSSLTNSNFLFGVSNLINVFAGVYVCVFESDTHFRKLAWVFDWKTVLFSFHTSKR